MVVLTAYIRIHTPSPYRSSILDERHRTRRTTILDVEPAGLTRDFFARHALQACAMRRLLLGAVFPDMVSEMQAYRPPT